MKVTKSLKREGSYRITLSNGDEFDIEETPKGTSLEVAAVNPFTNVVIRPSYANILTLAVEELNGRQL